MISREKKLFAQFILHTQTTTQKRVTQKNRSLPQKKKKMAAVLKSPSEICWKNFVNILHFLPLRTKMALARPILKLDL